MGRVRVSPTLVIMTDWLIVDLDSLVAARAGLPPRVVVPAGVDPNAATPADLAQHATAFTIELPDHELAPELGRLVAKQRSVFALQQALATGAWEDAMRACDEVLAIDPADAPARLNRAVARREAGDIRGALADLDAVAEVFANVALFHRNRARVLEDLGAFDLALAAYREALDLAPGDPAVMSRLRELGVLTTVSGPEGPVEVDREVLADLVRRDLAMHGDDHSHLVGAARALLADQQPDLAVTAATLALAANTDDQATRLVLIEALLAASRADEALVEAVAHVELVPASALGHELRAVALSRLGRDDEARVAAVRAIELDPASTAASRILSSDP